MSSSEIETENNSQQNQQAQAIKGWASRLTVVTVAILIIESVTGLWIYLAPFSVSSQVQVLFHTVLGITLFVPYFYYQTQHFLVWYRQNTTSVMVLGYALMGLVLVCLVSGVVVTWQAAFGLKISTVWDNVHLMTGVTAFVLILFHLVLAFLRRRIALKKVTDFSHIIRGFVRYTIVSVVVSLSIVVSVSMMLPSKQVEMPIPAGYSLPSYIQKFDEYRGSPFAPTYARTEGGGLINPEILSGSESCGSYGCHEEILAEWQPSAHRFSAMNEPFQQVQKNFAEDRGPAETRYCAGCHDPISLFAGAKDIQNLDLASPGMQEGNSCVACHAISSVDQRGNADYVLSPPKKYIWEGSDGWKKFTSDFLIRSYPQQHLDDYDRNLLRTPEFCGACHKQFIPEALNRFGVSPGQNQYDEWRKSHWHVADVTEDLSCRDCHMRLVRNSSDPGRGEGGDIRRSSDDGAHRHHGMIGTNIFIPELYKFPNWERHVKLTIEWMQGKTVLPEIAHLWPAGDVADLEIISPEEVKAGEELAVKVLVANKKAGHNFITGPLDFTRAWIHLLVVDTNGNIVKEWGGIDPETRSILDEPGIIHRIGNSRKEGTMVLEALPLNEKGEPITKHELWQKAGGKGLRVIFPRYSDGHTFIFTVPSTMSGSLTVKASLNFRRYRQEFLNLVLPNMEEERGVYQPTVIQTFKQKHIVIKQGQS